MAGLRRIPAESLLNLRDLGGYAARGGAMTQYGRLFRCDRLSNITDGDKRMLLDLGIRTVVDLRDSFEIKEAPNSLAGTEGVDYHMISLMETPRTEDGRVAGVPTNIKDMSDLYLYMADSAREQIAQVLEILANRKGAALFHCTAGKDRTGIIAALTFSIAGVSRPDIVADYVVSAVYMRELFAEIISKMGGAPPVSNMLESNEGTILAFLNHIDNEYGGARQYLLGGGLAEASLEALAQGLIGE